MIDVAEESVEVIVAEENDMTDSDKEKSMAVCESRGMFYYTRYFPSWQR